MKRYLRWAAMLVVGVAAILFVRRLDPDRALAEIENAHIGWLLLAMLVNATLRVGTRVLRTRSLLEKMPGRVPLRDLAAFVYGSMALGYVVSPIAGSAARVFALQHHGVPSESVVAVSLWEKVITACTIAAFSAVMLFGDNPPEVHYPLLVATILGAVALAIALLAVAAFRYIERHHAPPPSSRVRRWLIKLGSALATLTKLSVLVRTFVWSSFSELCDIAMLALVMHSLGLPVDLAACVLAFVVMNISTVLPSTPGQLGVFEAATAYALVAAGVASERALAAGFLYHLVHVVPVFLVGLPSLLRIRVEKRKDDIARSMRMPAQS
ncbi:MAG TPA: lysylphosphatidylglycerol synthase transmembrane domain-containing protein [Kofleriaceae bacterium]|jgi:uncharacterized protein (TIRG00374 family)